ncbi:hypothetical protein D3C76_1682070 [compost metagenome]
MQIKFGTVSHMVPDLFIACCTSLTEIKHFRFKSVADPALGNLKNDLLNTTHGLRVVRFKEVQYLDHCPLITFW